MVKHLKSATLIHHSKIMVPHDDTERVAIAELKIWEVPQDSHYPEGRKYSLFLVWKDSGEVILGIDNHKPKGPHIHRGESEKPYPYRGEDELVDEFWGYVREEGFLI